MIDDIKKELQIQYNMVKTIREDLEDEIAMGSYSDKTLMQIEKYSQLMENITRQYLQLQESKKSDVSAKEALDIIKAEVNRIRE